MLRLLSGFLLCAGLLTASVTDIWSRTIPYSVCILIAAAGLMNFSPVHIFGVLLAAPFFIAAMRNKGGMGDVFLIAASSFALGLRSGTVGLMLGLFCFILYFLSVDAVRKCRQRQDNPVSYPLAPFLAVGFIAAYFIGG